MLDVVIPAWAYPILVWTIAWKAVAAWKAARNNHLVWFVVIFIVNTFGILPIIYIFFFQRVRLEKQSKKRVKKKSVKKKSPSLVR